MFSFVLGASLLIPAFPAYAARRCYSPGTASRHLHQKVCIKAHVYQEIDLHDGSRILDVCSPRTSAANCRFAFISPADARIVVGSLKQYVGTEIEVHGKVQPIHGRAEIVLTSAKQIHAAQPENPRSDVARTRSSHFHPNPALLKGFNTTQSRMPIAAPAFRSSGRD